MIHDNQLVFGATLNNLKIRNYIYFFPVILINDYAEYMILYWVGIVFTFTPLKPFTVFNYPKRVVVIVDI